MTEESDGKGRLRPRKLWIESLPFSPDHRPIIHEASPPKLRLTHFSTKAVIDFGNVKVGKSSTRKLVVENPNFYEVEVNVEKFPWKKNFSITEEVFNVDEKGFYNLEVIWTPKESGNCRELVMMKYDTGFRVHALLIGHADSPAKKMKKRTKRGRPVKKSLVYGSNATASSENTSHSADNAENFNPSPFNKIVDSVSHTKSPFSRKDSSLPGTPPCFFMKQDFSSLRGALLPLHVVNSDNPRDSCGSITAPTSPSGLDAPVIKSGNSSLALNTAKQALLSPIVMRTPKEMQRETFCIDPKISKLPQQPDAYPVPDLTGRPTLILPAAKMPVTFAQSMLNFQTPTKNDSDIVAFKLTPRSHRRSHTFTKNIIEQPKDDKDAKLLDCETPAFEKPSAATEIVTKTGTLLDCSQFCPDDSLENVAKPEKTTPSPLSIPLIKLTADADSAATLDVHSIELPLMNNEVTEHLSSTHTHERTNGGPTGTLPVPDISVIAIASPTRAMKRKSPEFSPRKNKMKRTAPPKPARASPKQRPTKSGFVTPKLKNKALMKRKTAKTSETLPVPKLGGGSAKKKLRNSTLSRARKSPSAGLKVNLSASKKSIHDRPKSAKKRKPKMPITRLLLKPPSSARRESPLIRNPYASRNMCYDERWRQKQEYAYTAWLNYILTPDEFKPSLESKDCSTGRGKNTTMNHAQVFAQKLDKCNATMPALTKESASMRAYRIRNRLNCLRRSGMKLFLMDEFREVIGKVEEAVESGHIKLRTDKQLWADIGQKGKVLEWLLSFHALWLRLGLEVTFGDELVPSMDTSALSSFISKKLLSCVDIQQEFAHPTVPHCFRPGYTEKISKYILKKFLILIYFLDQAKVNRLIDHDPCLFRKESEYRNCKDILQQFSSELLRGEGDIVKHLGFLGYRVKYQQIYIDEFEFGIRNVAIDLRDGIRLVRIVELLFHKRDLTPKLRVPAGSLLQKKHNVNIALKALGECGVEMCDGNGREIETSHIVKGHCEMTLALLWNIASYFQLYRGVDEKSVQDEIEYLKRNLRLKHMMQKTKNFYDNDEDSPINSSQTTGMSALLLEWCRLVCAFRSIPVHNFGSSFTDGRVLACLVSHYQSNLIQPTKVNMNTTLSQHDQDLNFDDLLIVESLTVGEINRSQLMRNEKANLKMVQNAAYEMGGIPDLLRIDDICNTIPDDKVVRLFLSFLCVRLLDISTEDRAARTIQVAWRAYKYRKIVLAELQASEEEKKRRDGAAVVIQAAYRSYWQYAKFRKIKTAAIAIQRIWRSKRKAGLLREKFLKLKSAAVLAQTLYRAKQARKSVATLRQQRAKQISAACVVQFFWRGRLLQKKYLAVKGSTIKIQRFFRKWRIGKTQRMEYLAYKSAVVKVQVRWRETLEMRKQVAIFSTKKEAAILIQTAFREYSARKRAAAAVLIQRKWRANQIMRIARYQYASKRSAAITIQSAFHAFRARRMLVRMREEKKAATIIQERWRAHVLQKEERCKFLRLKDSAIIIQACIRSQQARKALERLRREYGAAVLIQRKWRATLLMKSDKQRFVEVKRASLIIQCAWRCVLARKESAFMKRRRDSVLLIQFRWRAHCRMKEERCRFLKLKDSVIVIQAQVRSWMAQKMLRRLCRELQAAELIQKKWRATLLMRTEKKKFSEMKKASLVIQCTWRCVLARKEYVRMKMRKDSILAIQRRWRAHTLMKEDRCRFLKLKVSAIVIQTTVRSYRARRTLERLRIEFRAATLIQSRWRATLLMWSEMERFFEMKKASVTIQCAWRCALARKEFKNLKHRRNAILVIQSRWRAALLARNEQKMFLRKRNAAIQIQRAFRCALAKMKLAELKRRHSAAWGIQRLWKATLKMRDQRKLYLRKKEAVVMIQCFIRCVWARRKLMELRSRRDAARVIQIRWRAFVLMRVAKESFLIKRKAAITLQTRCRGFLARRIFKKKRAEIAAVKAIQARWRATLNTRKQRKAFLSMKDAASVIQRSWRCYLARKMLVKLKKINGAAVMIQKKWRAILAMRVQRKEFERQKNASIIVQCAFRQHQTRRIRNVMKRRLVAIVVIQRKWMATLAMQQERRNFFKKRKAAITIQCWVRVVFAKTIALRLRAELAATKVLQKYWRAYVETRVQRDRFLEMKRCAVIIQCAYRCALARKDLEKMRRLRDSATVIQNRWKATMKMQATRKVYLREKQACIVVQCAWRNFQARRHLVELRTRYQSATLIQTRWKAHLSMKVQRAKFLESKTSAIKIQSFFRSILAKNELWELRQRRDAAVTIQTRWRATMLMRDIKRDYLRKRKAAVIIQCAYRCFAAKKVVMDIQKRIDAALVMQGRWRATLLARKVRGVFLRQRAAAVTIQCAFRCFSAKKKLMELERRRDAAILIQKKWRVTIFARKIREEFLQKRNSSVIIQCAFRRFQSEKILLNLRKRLRASKIIQERWRAMILMKNERAAFQQKRDAVIIIQRATRVYLSKRKLDCLRQRFSATLIIHKRWRATVLMRQELKMYAEKQNAILKIQCIFRCILAKKVLVLRKRERDATVVIQKRWRAILIMRRDRESFLRKKRAAAVIQSAFWCHSAKTLLTTMKREFHAAKVIQRHWKATTMMKIQRAEFLKKKKAAVIVQSGFRQFLAQKALLQLKKEHESATKLQTKWKATLLMREAKHEFQTKKYAAVCVQCAYRSYLARKRLQSMRNRARAVVVIQARWRATMLMNRQQRAYLNDRRRIVVVQNMVRGFLAKQSLLRLKREAKSATIIQRKWRGFLMMRTLRGEFLEKKAAASLVQRAFKRQLAHKNLMEVRTKRMAAAKIQARWKATMLMRAERRGFLDLKQAAIKVQSYVRRLLAQKLFQKMVEKREAAKVIQARWRTVLRMREERETFLKKKDAAVVIQRAFRSVLAKGKLARMKHEREAATAIQMKWRAYVAMKQQRNEYLKVRRSAITIQCFLRKVLAIRELRYLKQLLHAVIVVQKHWRAWALSRRERNRYLRIVRSTRVIQSFYRGHLVRRSITDLEVVRAKRKCSIANEHARQNPHRKICNRMNSALSVLLDARAYDTVYATLQDLYSLSWLLPYCCERISEDGGTEVLCQLITYSNRSYHAAFVQKFAINILLNLIKNESTRCDTCQVLATNDFKSGCAPMEMLVTVLSRFRDKGNRDQSHILVFCAACTLLIEFCRDADNAKILMSKSKSIDMIKYINRETTNKMKIKAKYEEVRRGKKERESVGYMTLSSTLGHNVLNQSNMLDVTARETSFLRDMDSLRVSTPKTKTGKAGAENRNPSRAKQKQNQREPSVKKIVTNLFGDNPAVPKMRQSLLPQKPGFHTNIPIHRPKKVTKPLSPNFQGGRAKAMASSRAQGGVSNPLRVPRVKAKTLTHVAYDELDPVSCIRCLSGFLTRSHPTFLNLDGSE